MPCTELFDQQSIEYQKSVLIGGAPIVSLEAAGVLGWRKYAHVSFGLDNTFGMSAPAEQIYAHFGLTKDVLLQKSQEVIAFYTPAGSAQPVAPSLLDFPRFPVIKGHH
jgi:transketolase